MVVPAVVIVGDGFTVIVIGNKGDPHPEPVQVMVQLPLVLLFPPVCVSAEATPWLAYEEPPPPPP